MFTRPYQSEETSFMFGSLGIPELILIFIVALIVFGPKRLPEIGRTLGKAMGEFKKATDDFKNTIEREVQVEELKQLASTTIPVHEAISRSEPVTIPTASGEPEAPPAQIADLTPEALTPEAVTPEIANPHRTAS
jgi:TatA/E family protein of Tat protein translocase